MLPGPNNPLTVTCTSSPVSLTGSTQASHCKQQTLAAPPPPWNFLPQCTDQSSCPSQALPPPRLRAKEKKICFPTLCTKASGLPSFPLAWARLIKLKLSETISMLGENGLPVSFSKQKARGQRFPRISSLAAPSYPAQSGGGQCQSLQEDPRGPRLWLDLVDGCAAPSVTTRGQPAPLHL